MEASQRDNSSLQPTFLPQSNTASLQGPDQDFFAFLKADEEEKHQRSPSFFSENGLGQDIIKVTGAEPDVCLEVFYALYHVLWPQIEKQSNVSFKDAWIRFIGGSITKGSLCPPEKLIAERRIRDIKRILSEDDGETQIFHDLDQVVNSISHLKQKVTENINYNKEIIASLDLVQEFYLGFRNQVKAYIQAILEKEQANVSYVSELEALEDFLEPKAIMMSDIFKKHWAYRIPRNRARKLLSLDMYGRNIKSNLNDPSSHRVTSLPEKAPEPLVFFKANGNPPIQPEKEFMVYSLYRHLQIPVPETALLVLTDVFEANPEYFYAIQASEAVLGEPPLKACQDPETIFDQETFASQVIGALLTNPSDGSFKNFKYSPEYKTLICIDNDLVFKPELISENVVNVKSILYLLAQIDLPIPESIKTFFSTLDPHLTVFSWLQDLSQKNREYNLLFAKLAFQKTRCIYENLLPQSETPSLESCLQQSVSVDPELHGEPFKPQILISRSLLNNLTEKLQIIEKTLLNNRSVSPQSLFEEISPALGKYYRKLRFEFNDIKEALEALWGNKKNGIDYSEISSLLDPEEFSSLPEIGLDENITPERFFEEFQDILKSGDSALDRFIRRHNERLKKNVLNLRATFKELHLLRDKRLINSRSIRDIVDFCHSLSKTIDSNHHLIKEITSILSNLPHPELKWLLTLEKYFVRADRSVPKDLMSSSTPVLGALMKQRTFLLSELENQYLFDEQGNIRKNPFLTGRSCVTCFPNENPEFYLKQYPEWPGYEFASTLFMRSLGVHHLPYQDLIIIKNYPVLLSQKVPGIPVLHVWNNPKVFHNLDSFQTALLIISAMLLNPEDGKEDNFILSPDGRYLIPIDNDHCFLPSFFQKEGSFWNAFTVNTALQTKTLLFCLDEMYMPISPEVKQHILSINFDERLPQWMAELDKLENQFNNLIDQNQRNRFLEYGTVIRIPFYRQFIQNMYWKAHKIQDILKKEAQPTPFDLLKAVEPFAAKCYQDSFKKGSDLQTRFKAATDQLYTKTAIDGSRMSILNTRTMMEIVNISEEELQKDAAYQRMGPVDAIELLNHLIQERSERVQREEEMLCELDEKTQEKKWFSLFGNSPIETSLKAFLADPKEGLALKGSKLITSSKLTELFAQTTDKGMRIRFLSLPESPLLTSEGIRTLAQECPNLEYLNVSGCIKLRQIFTVKGEWPLLVRLEAKDCLNLEKLTSSSPMRILRVGTDSIIEIIVEKSTLDIFAISKKKIKFDLSVKIGEGFQIKLANKNLPDEIFLQSIISPGERPQEYFQGINMTIGTYSISSPKDLAVFVTVINLQNLKLKAENMQRMSSLKLVNLKKLRLDENVLMGANLLKYLVQADWPKLNDFSIGIISDDGMQILAQGNWPLLETLNLKSTGGTKKGALNLFLKSDWPNLSKFTSNENHLSKNLPRKNWSLLEELDLRRSMITQNEIELIIKRSNWPRLRNLNLSSNNIGDEGVKILSEGDWPFLENLNLAETKITAVGIEALVTRSTWSKLKDLDLSFNSGIADEGLEALSRGDWPLIETLNLRDIEITKKGLFNLFGKANWPNLKEFDWNEGDFEKNFLQKNWPLAEKLDLSDSKFTKNEVELMVNNYKWPRLKHLNLSFNNEINDDGLEILSRGNWPCLETLDLRYQNITQKRYLDLLFNANWPNFKEIIGFSGSAQKFAESLIKKDLSQVQRLDFSNLTITLRAIESILKRNNYKWPQLKYLNFSHHQIFGEGKISAIAVVTECPLLEELHLENTKITSEQMKVLLTRAKWPRLKYFNLSNNEISDEGISMLALAEWPLLENLNLHNTKLEFKRIKMILHQPKWLQIKTLNISYNEISDEGLSVLALKEWLLLEDLNLRSTKITQQGIEILVNKIRLPNLKKLDVSENAIFDEGLKTLLGGSWPLFQHLVYFQTKVTHEGHTTLFESFKWPDLNQLGHSLTESFYNFSENLDEWSPPKILLAMAPPASEKMQCSLVSVLDASWFNSKEIYLSLELEDDSFEPTILMLPREKLDQLDTIDLSVERFPIQLILWPPHLKKLNLSGNLLADKTKLESLLRKNCLSLEILNLAETKITAAGIEIIIARSKWPNLKYLNLSGNDEIGDKGLEILSQGNWPLLETLNLSDTKITEIGIEGLVTQSKWLELKCLNLSGNDGIGDKGLETLSQGNWPLLEVLNLECTDFTKRVLLNVILNLKWLNLKEIKYYEFIKKSPKRHLQNNCNLLQELDLSHCKITKNEIELMVKRPNWVQLNYIDLSFNDRICDEEIEILSQGNWPLLETLNLSDTKITAVGIEIIITRANWLELKRLNLSGNDGIGDSGFEALSRGNWPLLETLSLKNAGGTKKGVFNLLLRANWPKLKEIDFDEFAKDLDLLQKNSLQLEQQNLSDCGITQNEIELIIKRFNWPQLKLLDLSLNSGINDEALETLSRGD